MAYVMTLKQGEDFYVNDVRFVLTEIVSSAAVKIQRDSDGKLFQMADGEVHQIAPLDVCLRWHAWIDNCGEHGGKRAQVRID